MTLRKMVKGKCVCASETKHIEHVKVKIAHALPFVTVFNLYGLVTHKPMTQNLS